jgi:methyl-accepting chemotaxis protein
MPIEPTPIECPEAPADDPAAAGAPRGWRVSGLLRQLRQRRRFLVNRRQQLRASLLTTTTALALVALLDASIYSARTRSVDAMLARTPELAPWLRDQARLEFGLVLAASAVFVLAVFLVTILETHKTAGAAYNLIRQIERVRDGEYATRLVLRKDDNLRDVEAAFNEMTRALRARARTDADAVQHVAALVARIEGSPVARDAVEALEELAAQQTRRIL